MHEILTCLALPAPAAARAAYSGTTGVLLSTGSNVWWQLSSHQPRKGVRWTRGLRRTITSARKTSRARKWKEINSKCLSRCLPTHPHPKQTNNELCARTAVPFLWALRVKPAEFRGWGRHCSPILNNTDHRTRTYLNKFLPEFLAVFYDQEFGTYAIPTFSWLTLILLLSFM